MKIVVEPLLYVTAIGSLFESVVGVVGLFVITSGMFSLSSITITHNPNPNNPQIVKKVREGLSLLDNCDKMKTNLKKQNYL
jgi:hypothetical protein